LFIKVDKKFMKASDADEALLFFVDDPIIWTPLYSSQEDVGIADSLFTSFGNPLSIAPQQLVLFAKLPHV
jgi:hypothetical protein